MGEQRAKNCTVLYVTGGNPAHGLAAALRTFGVIVNECARWPDNEHALTTAEAVIVHVTRQSAARLAMTLRAKRLFGRRVLVGLAPPDMTRAERHEARDAGFDAICDVTVGVQALLATILRTLRKRPEFTCRIPKTSAA